MKLSDLEKYLGILNELRRVARNGEPQLPPASEKLSALTESVERALRIAVGSVDPIPYEKSVFRAIKAKYANCPLSWVGSLSSPGRFHYGDSQPTLHFAEAPETVAREVPKESFAGYRHEIFPAKVKLSKVWDFGEPTHRDLFNGLTDFLTDEWRYFIDHAGIKPFTHVISDVARYHGFEAIRYEAARNRGEFNLAVFPKNLVADSSIALIDPSQNQSPTEMTKKNLGDFEEL